MDKSKAPGLIKNWKKASQPTKRASQKEVPSVQVLGGLSETDASATKPKAAKATKTARIDFNSSMFRDSFRKNEMVAAASDSDTSDFEPSPLKPAKSSKKLTTAPSQISKKSKKSTVQSKALQDTDHSDAHPSGSLVSTRVSGLPEFAKIGNEKPFDNFLKDSPHFLKIVQSVLSTVYPRVDHKIKGDDLLLKTANDRINEKKSKIATTAVMSIEKHLQEMGLDGDLVGIHRWCVYAKRPNGPLFWKVPKPEKCTVDSKHKDYIKPEGFMESDFVMDIARLFLKHKKGSAGEYGHPRGLLSVIGAALERAVRAYKRGIRAPPPQFSGENDGARVTGYMNNFFKFKEHHWELLLCNCDSGLQGQSDDIDFGDISLLEEYRGNLFNPSSPMKQD